MSNGQKQNIGSSSSHQPLDSHIMGPGSREQNYERIFVRWAMLIDLFREVGDEDGQQRLGHGLAGFVHVSPEAPTACIHTDTCRVKKEKKHGYICILPPFTNKWTSNLKFCPQENVLLCS
jgi:hypothetical protein